MERRFIDAEIWQALRKLNSNLKQLYFYAWSKADPIGVYLIDWDYLKIDLGLKYSIEDFLKLPSVKKMSEQKVIFEDFIMVNYGCLKVGYNPHKPAFRALELNRLIINSSLNQASFKLEEEGEYKEEGKEEGGVGEIEKPTTKIFIHPTIEEINKYCMERKNSVNPEKWLNHYQSNGWMVGKNKMKDWQAAIRTWEKSDFVNNSTKQENSDSRPQQKFV